MNRWFPVMRDVVLLTGGVLGIAFQTLTGDVNPLLLAVFTTMLGIPGVTNGLWLLRNGAEQQLHGAQEQHSSLPSTSTSSLSSEVADDNPAS